MPYGVLPAGAYHGVTLFFEIDLQTDPTTGDRLRSADLPEVAQWNERERASGTAYYRQLPPLLPEMLPGGVEVYRIRDIHRVEYRNGMFEVGRYRYVPADKSRLYVFKTRREFSFRFRGQEVRVPSSLPWTPSVYYYPEEVAKGPRRVLVREIVQVALARIESYPTEGYWLVNGIKFFPTGDRPLVLRDALHSRGTR
jgi:hypothetical protein